MENKKEIELVGGNETESSFAVLCQGEDEEVAHDIGVVNYDLLESYDDEEAHFTSCITYSLRDLKDLVEKAEEMRSKNITFFVAPILKRSDIEIFEEVVEAFAAQKP